MNEDKAIKNGLIITKNGDKEWYQHGKKHRDNDLPTVEHKSGDKAWHKQGKVHRDNDLPAIEWGNGTKEWWINGERLKEKSN